jgi:ribosomal protein L40E
MIEKKNGIIHINGTPAQDVGRLIARKGVVGAARRENEWAFCRKCRAEKPITEFNGMVSLGPKGYSGTCMRCDSQSNRTDK